MTFISASFSGLFLKKSNWNIEINTHGRTWRFFKNFISWKLVDLAIHFGLEDVLKRWITNTLYINEETIYVLLWKKKYICQLKLAFGKCAWNARQQTQLENYRRSLRVDYSIIIIISAMSIKLEILLWIFSVLIKFLILHIAHYHKIFKKL